MTQVHKLAELAADHLEALTNRATHLRQQAGAMLQEATELERQAGLWKLALDLDAKPQVEVSSGP